MSHPSCWEMPVDVVLDRTVCEFFLCLLVWDLEEDATADQSTPQENSKHKGNRHHEKLIEFPKQDSRWVVESFKRLSGSRTHGRSIPETSGNTTLMNEGSTMLASPTPP